MRHDPIAPIIDLDDWHNLTEIERLDKLQYLAEIRAISAHNNPEEDLQKSDGIFNRNVRIAASLSKLKYALSQRQQQQETTSDWIDFLNESTPNDSDKI